MRVLLSLFLSLIALPLSASAEWFKGQTHTHTLWSDGDAPPDYVAKWFKDNDYNFLVMSEHHFL